MLATISSLRSMYREYGVLGCLGRACKRVLPAWVCEGILAKVRQRYQTLDFATCLRKAPRFLLKWTLRATLVPWLTRRFLSLLGFRVVPINTGRIGHLVGELDGFVKETQLQLVFPRIKGIVLTENGQGIANESALALYAKRVYVVRSRLLCGLLANWDKGAPDYFRYDIADYLCPTDQAAKYPKVVTAHGRQKPVIEFSPEEQAQGAELLAELGVPRGAWFVCVHCREAGFHQKDIGVEHVHNFRNSSIDNYIAAIQAIVQTGGWCIRMGDPTMRPMSPMPGLIDYAHHRLRNPWLDLFLSGNCRFFLGSASGLSQVATAFGVPCAIANQAPLGVLYNCSIDDINIPKLYWSDRRQAYLSFPEIINSPISNYRYAHLFEDDHIRLIENTSDEIKGLALEMLEYVSGTLCDTAEVQAMQRSLRRMFRTWHYSYYSLGRISSYFLKKHKALFCPNQEVRDIAA